MTLIVKSHQTLSRHVTRGVRRLGWAFIGLLALISVALLAFGFVSQQESLRDSLLTYVMVGFLAQIIDGALGMAYGVSSTTFLLSTGISPAIASASVHAAGSFTTLVSGLSHLKLGNVDRTIFRRLVMPGMVGGIAGAYILSNVSGSAIKPLVSVYLMLMGLRILLKALRESPKPRTALGRLPLLAFTGGFFDAVGGGGWGPIVTTTLLARGNPPRTTIGSVNLAEFFVTVAQTITFVLAISLGDTSRVIAGLVIGGVMAAPLAAVVCRALTARKLMVIVGVLIIALSLRTIGLVVV